MEGFVQRIFTQRLAHGFVEGPCFTFGAEIAHAMSGGPVMSEMGTIRGINSAGATQFFNGPTTAASLLYPLLFTELKFGAQMGIVRLNASQPMISLVTRGVIPTDGSEQRVGFQKDPETGKMMVLPRSDASIAGCIHDDLAGLHAGKTATRETQPSFRLRREPAESENDSKEQIS